MKADRETRGSSGFGASHLPSSTRRRFITGLGALTVAASRPAAGAKAETGQAVTLTDGPRPLVSYPGKRPRIRVSTRPPHLETPFSAFNEGPITANDAFFVRYHLANIPLSVHLASYRIAIRGSVNKTLELSLDDLKTISDPVEVIAVNQCSGNSRVLASPRVFGAQLANGAMGNARWIGVPLRAVLLKAGVAAGAKQVTFDGLDTPVLPGTSDFRKSLEIEHAPRAEPLLGEGDVSAARAVSAGITAAAAMSVPLTSRSLRDTACRRDSLKADMCVPLVSNGGAGSPPVALLC